MFYYGFFFSGHISKEIGQEIKLYFA